jgi:small-conductance mechanosensitive channel
MESILELFEIHLKNPWIAGLINACIILALVSLILVVSNRIIRPTISRFLGLFESSPDEEVISAFLTLIRKIIVLIGLGLALTSLPLPIKIELFIHSTIFVIVSFFTLLGLFDLSNIISLIVRRQAPEFEILSNRILKITFSTVVLMITMRHFNYDIWHIMTALGVGTLAVGLAAQPTLANMIAGFTILIDRPFKTGDRIALSSGETGDVVNIGLRSTRIQTSEGNTLVVSNSEMVTSRLINYSFPNSEVGSKLKFYFHLDSPIQEAKATLSRVGQNVSGATPGSVSVLLTGVTEWSLEVTVWYKAEHYTIAGQVTDELISQALVEFKNLGIKLSTSPVLNITK